MSRQGDTDRDRLTTVGSRAAYDNWARDAETAQNISLLLVDLDHLKEINTKNGHLIGDVALQEVGYALRQIVGRYKDASVYRYGGDEFIGVMVGYSAEECVALARAIVSAVVGIHNSSLPIRLTVSVGVATGEVSTVEELLFAADRALRVAKQNGRNGIEIFTIESKDGGPTGTPLGIKAARRDDKTALTSHHATTNQNEMADELLRRQAAVIGTVPGTTQSFAVSPQISRGHASLPLKVTTIYTQTIAATKSGLDVLAAIGIRALIEAVCSDCQTTGSNLQQKIDDLDKKGLLTEKSIAILHQTRFLGNRAAHETEAPSSDELSAALEVAEYLLQTVYLLPTLSDRLPKR